MPASSVTSILRQGLRYFYGESQFRDFSGGLNIRDAQSELGQNESPDLYNVTLDERGAIGKRLGYVKYNSAPFHAAFGRTTVGATATNCAIDTKHVGQFTCAFTETITDLWIYLDGLGPGTGSQVLKGVVYSDNAGAPNALLKTSNEVTVTQGQAAGWVQFNFASGLAVTSGTVYHLGLIKGANTNVARFFSDATGGVSNTNADTYSDGAADPFGTPTTGTLLISVYAGRSPALVSNTFYWSTGQNLITQASVNLFKDGSLVPFKTFTTSARCGLADFTGLLYIIHPVDGLFKYDGTTVSAVATGPKGTTLAPWQNKLWAAGDPANKPRVYFSNAGDGTTWGGTAFVDLREKDTEIVTCLSGASGLDVSGRPGLLAFKRRSTYRIFDSVAGQFQTLDPQIGTASAISVVNGFQRTVALSEKGIFWTDGVGPMRSASDKLQPLFDPSQISYPNLDLFCAGVKGDRMYFSFPRAASTANDTMIEYHPIQGWMTANSNAASCYATFGKDTEILYTGSPTVNGQVYQQLVGGSDDGAAITSRYQMRWVELTAGHPVRVTRARVIGRGIFTLNVFTDYQLAAGLALNVNLSASAAVYDNPGAIYDGATVLYGPLRYQSFVDFPQLGVLKAISIQYTETSTATGSGLPILGGAAPTIGSWGNYGVSLSYVPLGLS